MTAICTAHSKHPFPHLFQNPDPDRTSESISYIRSTPSTWQYKWKRGKYISPWVGEGANERHHGVPYLKNRLIRIKLSGA